MAVHFAVRGGVLCWTPGHSLVATFSLHDVTCQRCDNALDNWRAYVEEATREARRLRKIERAASATGLRELWDFVKGRGDDASNTACREIVASIIVWAAEAGYRADRAGAA